MKKMFIKKSKYLITTLSSKITIFFLLAATCFSSFETMAQQGTYNITGNATGAQMVPVATTNGSGTITGTYNTSSRILEYTSTWNNLTGAPKIAGFYIGVEEVAGKLLGDPWPLGTNNKPSGTIIGKITLTDVQAKDLLAGKFYYAYTTDLNASGEIRGQLRVVQSN